jgi:hypothetical protein
VAGLLPDVFWSLTWNDYDSLLFNHRYREQQALAGPRLVATQLYNIGQGFAKHPKTKTEEQYLSLPLIDPAPVAKAKADESWWAKMQALALRSGKKWGLTKD